MPDYPDVTQDDRGSWRYVRQDPDAELQVWVERGSLLFRTKSDDQVTTRVGLPVKAVAELLDHAAAAEPKMQGNCCQTCNSANAAEEPVQWDLDTVLNRKGLYPELYASTKAGSVSIWPEGDGYRWVVHPWEEGGAPVRGTAPTLAEAQAAGLAALKTAERSGQ